MKQKKRPTTREYAKQAAKNVGLDEIKKTFGMKDVVEFDIDWAAHDFIGN